MARHLIVIDFEAVHLGVGVVRNFGEDLWREFRYDKSASISLAEADRATTQLRVYVSSPRRVRRIQPRVLRLLKKHGYNKITRVSVVQENT